VSLKLGAAVYTYLWDCPLEIALQRVADLGFKYIEIMSTPPHVWIRGLDKQDRQALRQVLASNGLELVSLNPSYGSNIDLASTNPAMRQESVTQLKENIELLHDLGGQVVVTHAGTMHPLMPPPFETAWEWSKSGLSECAEHAERHDVILGLENVAAYGFVSAVRHLRQMLDEIDSPHLKIVYDVANAPASEYPPAALHELKADLALVHLSDRTSAWGHLPIGMGTTDFEPIADSLQAMAYPHVSILEVTHPQASDGGLLSSAAKLEALGWDRKE
jgi:sugar phosphate isomerase/epimerase